MLRRLLFTMSWLLLSACSGWVSDERFFGPGDWATVELAGPYRSDTFDNDEPTYFVLTPQADGMIEAKRVDAEGLPKTSLIGLVAIEDGSGEYFLMVDRSDPTVTGDYYFIANLSGGQLGLFYPDCNGTPDIEGMEKRRQGTEYPADEDAEAGTPSSEPQESGDVSAGDSMVCNFSTKDALMAAGRHAEAFLASQHIVAIMPFVVLSPDDREVTD